VFTDELNSTRAGAAAHWKRTLGPGLLREVVPYHRQIRPIDTMDRATFMKPAMLAPAT
jgi:hypothetical protein